jgi:hypothetical protein
MTGFPERENGVRSLLRQPDAIVPDVIHLLNESCAFGLDVSSVPFYGALSSVYLRLLVGQSINHPLPVGA